MTKEEFTNLVIAHNDKQQTGNRFEHSPHWSFARVWVSASYMSPTYLDKPYKNDSTFTNRDALQSIYDFAIENDLLLKISASTIEVHFTDPFTYTSDMSEYKMTPRERFSHHLIRIEAWLSEHFKTIGSRMLTEVKSKTHVVDEFNEGRKNKIQFNGFKYPCVRVDHNGGMYISLVHTLTKSQALNFIKLYDKSDFNLKSYQDDFLSDWYEVRITENADV